MAEKTLKNLEKNSILE